MLHQHWSMPMESRSLFVDFMYAVTVGAMLPRLDATALDPSKPLLWGMAFMVVVFLEDFYLYHVKVVPFLKDVFNARGFILAMLIIFSWYVSETAFPTHSRLFLLGFAFFFFVKLMGGVFMKSTKYPVGKDLFFLLPVFAAGALFCFADNEFFACHPERFVMFLAPIWLLTVAFWWA